MRLLVIAGLLGGFFAGFPGSTSPRSTVGEPAPFRMHEAGKSGRQSGDGRSQKQPHADISRSGREFAEVCSGIGREGGAEGEGGRDAARESRDATCLSWVAGFTEGFVVHDELLSVPRRDRLACVPNGESAIQIVRVMKRYIAKNPEKAHRATRYIASLALAGAFPCRGRK